MQGALEGLLFIVGDDGISKDRIKEIMEIDDNKLEELIESLKEEYSNNNRGIAIEEFGENYKLTTKKEHNEYYQKLVNVSSSDKLSQSSLETLAIIAYNSPITRNDIEEIRGVDCTYVLRKLMFLNLIKECGRSELPGRPILYGITDQLLDYLGVKSIDDIPKPEVVEVLHDDVELYDSRYNEENI